MLAAYLGNVGEEEDAAMFAPPVQVTKAKTASKSVPTHAPKPPQHMPLRPGFGRSNQTVLRILSRRGESLSGATSVDHQQEADPKAKPGASWDFSKMPVFAPDRPGRPGTPPPLAQPKLIIGQVNDPLEHEAMRVADQVMRVPDPELSFAATATQISRKSAAGAEAGPQTLRTNMASAAGEVPAVVDYMLRSSGEPLAISTRAFFEPRFDRDLGAVRIHTDSSAASAARSISAVAFTVGSDIAFAAGRYQPGSAAGQRLLAHELAHVVQQSGGAPGMTQGAPVGIQRAVETLGGEWSTDTYALVQNRAAAEIGVTMDRLHFKAKDPVDASRIGLTQMVNTIVNGVAFAPNAFTEGRSIPAGQPDAGSHIDRPPKSSRPYYGMDASGPPSLTAQWGSHHKFLGIPQHRDATLFDEPRKLDTGPNSSQLFETSALAVEGHQKGTFYGSVRWGWRSDASNKVTLEPLSVVSVGVPSATFKQSATLWNASKTSTGNDTVDLPIAAGSTSALVPSVMTDEQISGRLQQIAQELLVAVQTGQTTETLEFERQALEKEQRLHQMRQPPGASTSP